LSIMHKDIFIIVRTKLLIWSDKYLFRNKVDKNISHGKSLCRRNICIRREIQTKG